MPTIDDIHKDTTDFIVKTAKGKHAELRSFAEDAYGDVDLHRYIEHLPQSYELEEWEKDQEYSDKLYTIIRTELVGEDVSAIDNTMFFLGEKHLPNLSLSELPKRGQTRSSIKADDISISLSDILKKVVLFIKKK